MRKEAIYYTRNITKKGLLDIVNGILISPKTVTSPLKCRVAWVDDHFDRGDFAADCAGVLMYQVKF